MMRRPAILSALLVVAAVVPAPAIAFGPPPGGKLVVEKLAAIDDFLNGEIH